MSSNNSESLAIPFLLIPAPPLLSFFCTGPSTEPLANPRLVMINFINLRLDDPSSEFRVNKAVSCPAQRFEKRSMCPNELFISADLQMLKIGSLALPLDHNDEEERHLAFQQIFPAGPFHSLLDIPRMLAVGAGALDDFDEC